MPWLSLAHGLALFTPKKSPYFFKERFGKKQPIVTVTNIDTFEAETKAQVEEHKKQLRLFDELLGINPRILEKLVLDSHQSFYREILDSVRFDPVAESYIIRVPVNETQSVNEFVKMTDVFEKRIPGESHEETAALIAVERRLQKKQASKYLNSLKHMRKL